MTKKSSGDGEELKTEVTIMDKQCKKRARLAEYEKIPRKVYISKEDFEVHGYTEGCPGCKSVLKRDDETGTTSAGGRKRSWTGLRRRSGRRRGAGNT